MGQHRCAVDLVVLSKDTVLEIVCRQNALLVRVLDDIHQTFLLPQFEILVFFHVFVSLAGLRHQSLNIIDWEVLVSSHHNRLEVLRTHDGAYPGPASITAPVRVDTGELHHVLASHADSCNVDSISIQPFFDNSFSFQAGCPFQFRHGKNRRFTVIDEKDGQLRCPAGDGQNIDSRLPKLDTEVTTHG